jgi:trans-aconitate methyltransferase
MEPFEFDGEKYRKASAHQKEWGKKLIAELDLKGNESILDLGCGDGITTQKLAQLVPDGQVVGIDSSHGMIESAKKHEKGNLIFCVLNINDIGYKSKFDLIISNATLHWVKDHRKLLNNCHHALKINGRVRFNFAGDGNCQNFFKVIKEAMSDSRYRKCFEQFEWPWYMPVLNEYKNVVEDTDFVDVNLGEENADRYFPNTEAMIKWIDQPSIVPFLKHVSLEDKDSFRNFVADRMVGETKQEDGRCFETFRRINLSARK